MAFICVSPISALDAPGNRLPGGRAGAALTVGCPVYLDSNGVWQKAAASLLSVAHASRLYAVGFCSQIAQANEFISPVKRMIVRDTDLSLTVGAPVYLAASAGTVSQTAPAYATYVTQILGFANSAYEYVLDASKTQDIAAPSIKLTGANQALITVTAGTYGYDSAASAAAVATLLLELRSTLVALGIWKGSA